MRSSTLRLKDLCVFALLAAVIIASQLAMQMIIGVQLVGLFISAITLTYRVRALIPIYVYIALYCLLHFNPYSIPYLYIWLPLWGMFMVVGKFKMPGILKTVLSMILCGLYGLSFGTLYAPVQMIIMNWDFDNITKWIIIGFFTADIPHAINNFALGVLIIPLSELLKKLNNTSSP